MASANLFTAYIDIGMKGLDKVKSYMDSAVKAVQSSTSQISNAFSISTSAIQSFVGAASPAAMNTFGGSVEILKARIGQSFTPYILDAAKAVQNLANWVKNIDPDTKKQVASWIAYGTAAAGGFVILSKLAGLLEVVSKNPLAVVLLGIGAAALKAAADMDKLNKSMAESVDKMQRMKQGTFTEKEFKGGVADAILGDSSLTQEQKLAKAKEMLEKIKAETQKMNKEGMERGNLSSTKDYLLDKMGFENKTFDDMKKVEGNMTQIGMLEGLIKKLSNNEKVTFASEESVKKPGSKDRFMLGAMGGSGAGSIGGLDSAYNKLNSGALGMNDIQRELLKIQQEELKTLQSNEKKTDGILSALQSAMGL